jgi:histidinol-phosphate aminotransferase
MRIGLALGHADLIAELMKVKDSYNLNRLSIVAAIAALEDYNWMRQNVERIKATRSRLSQGLSELGFLVYPSQANFVMVRKRGEDLQPLYLGLKERGILVRYFSSPELRDSIRITVGTDEEIEILLRELRTLTA